MTKIGIANIVEREEEVSSQHQHCHHHHHHHHHQPTLLLDISAAPATVSQGA